jgi:hypothetical protein
MTEDRMQILKMVEAGQISTEDALQLLAALDETPTSIMVEAETENKTPFTDTPQVGNWWLVPTGAGAIVMAIGAPLMALGLSRRAGSFWAICCGWIPFLIGLTILTIGAWSRSARWLHLRIKNAHTGKMTFAISMPLPLTLAAWIIRLIRPFVPQLRDIAVEEMILTLRDGWNEGDNEPMFVEVEDGAEHVLVYIG